MNTIFFRTAAARRAVILLTVLGADIGLQGCSMATTSAEWAEPEDMGGEFSVIDDSARQWSQHIAQLPIELHGTWPGADAAQTAAMIPRSAAAPDIAARQRVVVYIDGTEVPQRADFCAVGKSLRPVPNTQKVTLRAALCDGPRIVSYARQAFDGNGKPAAADVASLESSLVGALHTPFNILDVEG